MSPSEIVFLGMVIGALSVFAIALAYASWIASGDVRSKRPSYNAARRARRAPKFRSAETTLSLR